MTTLQDEIEAARQTIRSDALAMSVGEIVNLYRDEEIIIRPEFQRLFRWDIEQKSRLIESLLLGIPIPSIFVMQREDGIWEVIDGLQRISTILEFMGELRDEDTKLLKKPSVLTETRYLPRLRGMSFVEDAEGATTFFTPGQRLALKRAKVDLKILLSESDERAKFELFDRLNTGGSLLSAQEIRNTQLLMRDASLFRWLDKLRQNADFQATIPISDRLLYEAYDMELVCRFFALTQSSDAELRGIENIDTFLSDKLFETTGPRADQFDRTSEEARFKRTFGLLNSVLGEDSFKRNEKGRFLGAFSVSAFETIAVGVGENVDAWEQTEAASPGSLKRQIENWWANTDFRSGSGSGISASTRLPKTLPAARRFFEK
ncbi:DUF262 domain-containing protein [Nocardia abscessus]|uniref:DUF262 domain-containing protein n=1 Tax=Nocardia abscessus TaxID=120957 RepID=UPI00245598B6|nr:DUF262 domain-containing protein [Nocardia abscessus]